MYKNWQHQYQKFQQCQISLNQLLSLQFEQSSDNI